MMMSSMTQAEFLSAVRSRIKSNPNLRTIKQYYEAFVEVLLDGLVRDREVKMPDLGVFSLSELGGGDRSVYDASVGAVVTKYIPPYDAIRFRPYPSVKKTINCWRALPEKEIAPSCGEDFLQENIILSDEEELEETIELMAEIKPFKSPKWYRDDWVKPDDKEEWEQKGEDTKDE